MKKSLASKLIERSDTVEYRAIVKRLVLAAQNKQSEYRIIYIADQDITGLQNEGINVTKITEFGVDKYLLKW